MKILLIALFMLLFGSMAIPGWAQSFEGTLAYIQDIEPPKTFMAMGIDKETFLKKMKEKPDWFDSVKVSYKGGDYYWATNSKEKLWKIYKAATNKLYSFSATEDGDICAVQNAVDLDLSGEPDKPEISRPDTTATINKYTCKLVRMQWKMSSIEYYYNANVAKVKPELFAQHSSEGFSEFLKISRALPIRIVRNVMGIKIIHTLAVIKAKQISVDLFKLPTLVADADLNMLKMPGLEVFRVKP